MTIQGPCDACSLIDGDTSPKEITKCKPCDADLCEPCKVDWGRRSRAAALKTKAKAVELTDEMRARALEFFRTGK